MATQLTPDKMIAALRKWQVNFIEYPGWRTRGYGPGSISDAEFLVWHHTGSAAQSDSYLYFLFVEGRPADGIPGPLCNVATRMNGQLILGAAERANHCGRGSSATLAKVKGGPNGYDWDGSTIRPGPDDYTGNSKAYGNEIMFSGAAAMTRAAYVTAVLWAAAWLDAHGGPAAGWGAWRVIGHKEHTSRKNDPGSTSMPLVRRDIAAALTAGPGNWPISAVEEWNMATGDEVLARVNTLITAEANRYQRYEDLFAAVLAALKAQSAAMTAEDAGDDAALRTAMDALSNSIAQLETEAASAGRYSHIISTLTEWAEGRDNIRQEELLTKLAELHPATEPPPLPKA